MKAWIVTDTFYNDPIIAWADTAGKAKSILLRRGDNIISYIDIRVRRIPEFDDKSYASIVTLLEKGWSFYCCKCGKKINLKDIDEGKAKIIYEENDFLDGKVICSICNNQENKWFQFILNKLK